LEVETRFAGRDPDNSVGTKNQYKFLQKIAASLIQRGGPS